MRLDELVCNWLINHFETADADLGSFLRKAPPPLEG